MIFYRIFARNFALFVFTVIYFSGCTYVLTIDEIPNLKSGSPLLGVGSSKTFAFNDFSDIRNASDPLYVGDVGTSKGVHVLRLEQPPVVIVPFSVKKELEKNGHKCYAYSTKSKADYIVDGNIYKYRYIFSHIP